MPGIEIFPPDHPLKHDASAATIYLSGRSSGADQWHVFAADMLKKSLTRSSDTVYIADQYRIFPDLRGSHMHNEWRDQYKQRATENGIALLWFSSVKVGASKGEEIQGILEAKRDNPELMVVCGAGIRCSNTPMYELRAELAELEIALCSSLKATCQAAVDSLQTQG